MCAIDKRVLVVGTTADYIHLLGRRHPGRALFLTAPEERANASEPSPDPASEVLCSLALPDATLSALREHLDRHRMELLGIVGFDCESMPLAARIAGKLSLPYPSPDAIAACRSKSLSKQLWQQAGIRCPGSQTIRCETEALDFFREQSGPVVLKPLTGSGSELTFYCTTPEACVAGFRALESGLTDHPDARLYAPLLDGSDPRHVFAIEEFVDGPEFSCDFTLNDDRVEVIRFARKIPATAETFGTTLAYEVPGELPSGFDLEGFRMQALHAARALGLRRALCMLDFIMRDNQAHLIELAPRPGGDCLPFLIRQSAGFDILGAALDFAEGRQLAVPASPQWKRLAGVRLFAKLAGTVRAISTDALQADPRVLECYLKCAPGHRVCLPPDDYDSRILGHAIFAPGSADTLEAESLELAGKLQLEMDPLP